MNLSFHFNIDAYPERRLVIAKIYGIWKEETARDYHEEYMEAVAELPKGNWAKITNLSNWKSSYPEITEILGEHIRWCHENGAEYSVFFIENEVTMRQLKAMIEKSEVGDAVHVFNNMREAEKFLAEKGYK